MRSAAFNTGPDFHLLDHIAPLADLMQMPLFVTEELNYSLALRYYPQVQTTLIADLEYRLREIADKFDVLFECKYWSAQLKCLFRQLYKKEMRLIFCPHGQSDKGFKAPLLAPYALQDGVLIYGDLMVEMLKELEIWPAIARHAIVGNYRLAFYNKYKAFYDEIAQREIFSQLNAKNPTLLYAPTWRDADQSTSFFEQGAKVVRQLPKEWNLAIKVHPLLEQRDPAYYYSIASLVEGKENALLISEFPPIYPILSQVDAFLGDFSSVGYDFLAFRKPLYFFPTSQTGKLHSCGKMLDLNQPIYSQICMDNQFSSIQTKLYNHSFGPLQSEAQITERILQIF